MQQLTSYKPFLFYWLVHPFPSWPLISLVMLVCSSRSNLCFWFNQQSLVDIIRVNVISVFCFEFFYLFLNIYSLVFALLMLVLYRHLLMQWPDLVFTCQQLMKQPSHGVASSHPETTKTLFTPARSSLEEFLGTLRRVRFIYF